MFTFHVHGSGDNGSGNNGSGDNGSAGILFLEIRFLTGGT
jgi:hypothetical protein